jgi:hypothetical protein
VSGENKGILRKLVRKKDVNLLKDWRKLCNWGVPSLMFG